MSSAPSTQIDVSVVMPCRSQADTLAGCIGRARAGLANLTVEVVVVDAGSSPDARRKALALGAWVRLAPSLGSAAAFRAGIESAAGRFIVLAEADGTYDFSQCGRFVEALQKGADLVVGNRYAGGIRPGAMTFSEQYFTTPSLNLLARLFFRSPVGDFHCGMLGLNKETTGGLSVDSPEGDFSTDTVARASLLRLRIAEAPITFSAPGRSQSPQPWQRLRFLLLRSPKWVFLFPGVILSVGGILVAALSPVWVTFGLCSFLAGFHACLYSISARIVASASGLIPRSGRFERLLESISLKKGLLAGGILTLGGLAGTVVAGPHKFPAAATFLGGEIVFASLFLSLLRLKGDPAS